jgi:tRNA-specific 2-thiouridylase
MKIALGMSGGVDSSLCAALLKDAGHDVTGVFLECWRAPGCRAEDDRKDALAVALDLGLPFRVLDFRDAYRERVVEEFFRAYERGLTPNPDIWCNTEIKFGLFYDWALKQGFDAIATGHYAQILPGRSVLVPIYPGRNIPEAISSDSPGGETFRKRSLPEKPDQNVSQILARGADEKKDQTYFLYRLRQDQLGHIVFPVGHLTKAEVRRLAKEKGMAVADKPDSQGICFIGDIDVREFLRERLGEKPGDVLDPDGNVIGRHQGVWLYTIGQRHGFELFPKVHVNHEEWKHVLPPLYVIAKDAAKNTITVGFGAETETKTVRLNDLFWREAGVFPGERQSVPLIARLRHGGALLPAQLKIDGGQGELTLSAPQRGIAPGQSVVFYDPDDSMICRGGGVVA